MTRPASLRWQEHYFDRRIVIVRISSTRYRFTVQRLEPSTDNDVVLDRVVTIGQGTSPTLFNAKFRARQMARDDRRHRRRWPRA